eukprot:tig00020519_g9977.t1
MATKAIPLQYQTSTHDMIEFTHAHIRKLAKLKEELREASEALTEHIKEKGRKMENRSEETREHRNTLKTRRDQLQKEIQETNARIESNHCIRGFPSLVRWMAINITRQERMRTQNALAQPEEEFTALNSVIAADFETFAPNRTTHVPYAVDMDIISKGEITETKSFCGPETLEQFMLWLDNWKEKSTLVFFNGSGFDLIFIYKWLVQNRPDCQVKVMRSSGKIKSMEWKTLAGGEFKSFDPCLHIQGSLRQAGKDYGVQ